jgi:hypothetical protein
MSLAKYLRALFDRTSMTNKQQAYLSALPEVCFISETKEDLFQEYFICTLFAFIWACGGVEVLF